MNEKLGLSPTSHPSPTRVWRMKLFDAKKNMSHTHALLYHIRKLMEEVNPHPQSTPMILAK
jgi:hypothetical protein